jgi:hypothetical protein
MTREQLEQKRAGLAAQMHWATFHRGDQELMDVLGDENDRLAGMLGRQSASPASSLAGRRPTTDTGSQYSH